MPVLEIAAGYLLWPVSLSNCLQWQEVIILSFLFLIAAICYTGRCTIVGAENGWVQNLARNFLPQGCKLVFGRERVRDPIDFVLYLFWLYFSIKSSFYGYIAFLLVKMLLDSPWIHTLSMNLPLKHDMVLFLLLPSCSTLFDTIDA